MRRPAGDVRADVGGDTGAVVRGDVARPLSPVADRRTVPVSVGQVADSLTDMGDPEHLAPRAP
jgi:hypothetical protein